MTFGSLFAGIGGFDLGFERAGLSCSWQVEINPFCQRVLAKHWPEVRRYGDIRTFPETDPQGWQVDVICGGFPCKQTSYAAAISGKRIGLEGKDSGLWFEMLRVVRLVRPRCVVVENVGGASSYATQIQRGLAESGYRVPGKPLCLSAENLGAPHLRRRLFWVAHRDEPGLAFARFREPSAAECESWRTVDGNVWLQTLPGVVRVADGIPSRLDRFDRISAVGNAVVPQMAEWIGRRLLDQATNIGGN